MENEIINRIGEKKELKKILEEHKKNNTNFGLVWRWIYDCGICNNPVINEDEELSIVGSYDDFKWYSKSYDHWIDLIELKIKLTLYDYDDQLNAPLYCYTEHSEDCIDPDNCPDCSRLYAY